MKIIKNLPTVLQTDINEKFIDATAQQIFSKKTDQYTTGYIGRHDGGYYSPLSDNFLKEVTKNRHNYQLEPVVVSENTKTLVNENEVFYYEFLDKLKSYGADITNHDRLFSGNKYSFSPPIDYDMFINYYNYMWVYTMQSVPLSFSTVSDLISAILSSIDVTEYDYIDVGISISLADGKQYIVTECNKLKNGKITNIQIDVLPYTRLPHSEITPLMWDNPYEGWDELSWDFVEAELKPDYITISRGSYNNNAWSRTNRWVHKDTYVKLLTKLGINQLAHTKAKRPIICFDKNIRQHNHGVKFNKYINYIFKTTPYNTINGALSSTTFTEIGGALNDGDLVSFVNDTSHNVVYEVTISGAIITLSIDTVPVSGDNFISTNGLKDNTLAYTIRYNGTKFVIIDNQKTKENQFPLFVLRSEAGNVISDKIKFLNKQEYNGSKLFSYEIDDFSNVIDPVLGLTLNYSGSTIVSNISFSVNMEAERAYDSSGNEIIGYYYYQKDSIDGSTYHNAWKLSERNKQKIVDRYIVIDATQKYYGFTTVPDYILNDQSIKTAFYICSKFDSGNTINFKVYINGDILSSDMFLYDSLTNCIISLSELNLNIDDVIEIKSHSYLPKLDGDGYYEIPKELELNVANTEITYATHSQLYSHFNSIISNQLEYVGNEATTVNNYRNTAKDSSLGEFIVHNINNPLKSMMLGTNLNYDIVQAIRFSRNEYSRIKNKIIKHAFIYSEQYSTFDDLLFSVLTTNEITNTFLNNQMLFYRTSDNDIYIDKNINSYAYQIITPITDLNLGFILTENEKNNLYISINNNTNIETFTEFLISNNEYTLSDISGETHVVFNAPTLANIIITVKLYNADHYAIGIPATPSKLGIYPTYVPTIVHEPSLYVSPVNYILCHDGSKHILFGEYLNGILYDIRDQAIFEFEKRIFNGIPVKFKQKNISEFGLDGILISNTTPDKKEPYYTWQNIAEISSPTIYKWASKNNANLKTHDMVDGNLKTYNWSVTNSQLPGNWRGMYRYLYGTDSPHIRPWECMGYSIKPAWFDTAYGIGTSFNFTLFWADIKNGVYYRTPPPTAITKVNQNKKRTWLSTGMIPVNYPSLTLKTPDQLSAIIPTTNEIVDWKVGDISPVEYAFVSSEEFPFFAIELAFLMEPGKFSELYWDANVRTYSLMDGTQQIDTNTKRRPNTRDAKLHDCVYDSKTYYGSGYSNFISNWLQFKNSDITKASDDVRNLTTRLGYKIAGFTNRDTIKFFLESNSLSSTSDTLQLQSDDYEVKLHSSPVTTIAAYSGIAIRKNSAGYELFGYDTMSGKFISYIRSINKQSQITVGATEEKYIIFETNKTYEKYEIVKYNQVYYSCVESHSATKFDGAKWKKHKLLMIGGITVSHKPIRTNELYAVEYGTTMKTEQEVYDFILGYGEFIETNGIHHIDRNKNNNFIWADTAKQFLTWSLTASVTGETLRLSPFASGMSVINRSGYPLNILSPYNSTHNIVDQDGLLLDKSDLKISRIDNHININPISSGRGLYFVRVPFSETEHVVIFKNETVFSDIIYSPLFGIRQKKLKYNGLRTENWNGKLEASGYLITNDNTVMPNLDSLASDIIKYHDVNTILDNKDIENIAKHSIGFTEQSHLNNLELTGDNQFQFYKGMIRQKGTIESINKLLRSSAIAGNTTFDTTEEWAIKLSTFGNIATKNTIDLKLMSSDMNRDVSILELIYPKSSIKFVSGVIIKNSSKKFISPPIVSFSYVTPVQKESDAAKAISVLSGDFELAEINITFGGKKYTNTPEIFLHDINGTLIYRSSVYHPEIELKVITNNYVEVDNKYDDFVQYDIDDIDKWLTKPQGDVSSTLLWPTITNIEHNKIPSAGYVHLNDIDFTSFDVKTCVAEFNKNTINLVGISKSYFWIAKNDISDWDVASLDLTPSVINLTIIDDKLAITFSGNILSDMEYKEYIPVYLAKFADTNGNYFKELHNKFVFLKLHDTASHTYYVFDETLTEIKPMITNTVTNSSGASAYSLISVRFDTLANAMSSNLSNEYKIWIDNSSTGMWEVYAVNSVNSAGVSSNAYWNSTTHRKLHRKNTNLINTAAFSKVATYSEDYSNVLSYFDPYKGVLCGTVEQNISFKSETDPARYTISSDEMLISDNDVFGEEELGMVWWDLSTYRTFQYEQGPSLLAQSTIDVIRDQVVYIKNNWGAPFKGSSVDIYEWTISDVPPIDYTDGIPKYIDTYVSKQFFNIYTGVYDTKYYFWVKNKETIPTNRKNRTMSCIKLKNSILNPLSEGFKLFVPLFNYANSIQSYSYAFVSNINDCFVSNEAILNINYDTIKDNGDKHSEWKLIKNTSDTIIPDMYWYKLVDSLTSLDKFDNYVPDQSLSEFIKYGISIRPRQTMFTDNMTARRVAISTLNSIFKKIDITKLPDTWLNGLTYIYSSFYYTTWYKEGYDSTNIKPTKILTQLSDNYTNGDIVKDYDDGNTFLIENNELVLIAKENGTIQIREEQYMYDSNLDYIDAINLRTLLTELKESIFTSELKIHYINFMFTMFEYVLSEQKEVDWLFKTSYINLAQSSSSFSISNYKISERIDDFVEYINEIKPFRTKLRGINSKSNDITEFANLSVNDVTNTKIKLKFDRINCHDCNDVFSSGWGNTGWDTALWDSDIGTYGNCSYKGSYVDGWSFQVLPSIDWDSELGYDGFSWDGYLPLYQLDAEEFTSTTTGKKLLGAVSSVIVISNINPIEITFNSTEWNSGYGFILINTITGDEIQHSDYNVGKTADGTLYLVPTNALIGISVEFYAVLDGGKFIQPQMENCVPEEFIPVNAREQFYITVNTIYSDMTLLYTIAKYENSVFDYQRKSSVNTTLSDDLLSDSKVIKVSDINALPDASNTSPKFAWIGNELIRYSGKSGNNLIGVLRGVYNTPKKNVLSGTTIYVGGIEAQIPLGNLPVWNNANTTLRNSTTIQAQFLLAGATIL